MRYWLFQLSPLPSSKLWNFKSVQTKPKFCSLLWKYIKQNWKLTKYITTEQKQNIIPQTFREMSIVLWNLVNFGKIFQFLIKFSKSLRDLRKIMLKWLGETVKYWFNFNNFCSCTEKQLKVGQTFFHNLNESS